MNYVIEAVGSAGSVQMFEHWEGIWIFYCEIWFRDYDYAGDIGLGTCDIFYHHINHSLQGHIEIDNDTSYDIR